MQKNDDIAQGVALHIFNKYSQVPVGWREAGNTPPIIPPHDAFGVDVVAAFDCHPKSFRNPSKATVAA